MSRTKHEPELIRQLAAHARWTRALAGRLVNDRDEADDLVQEAWFAALRRPPALTAPIRPWLATVVRNLVRDRHKISKRTAAREAETEADRSPSATPEEALAEIEMQRHLAGLVAELPDPLRHTIILRYADGHSSAEIARAHGVPEGTVRWRLKAALDQLRARLDAEHGGRETWRRLLAPLAAPSPALKHPRAPHAAIVAATPLFVSLILVLSGAATVSWRMTVSPKPDRSSAASHFQHIRTNNTLVAAVSTAGRLEGHVCDERGTSVPGALVSMARLDVPVPGAAFAPTSTTTNSDGRFVFPDVAPGLVGLFVVAPTNLAPLAQEVNITPGPAISTATIVLREKGYLLSGRVLDAGGGPVPGARLFADYVPARSRLLAVADDDGRYRAALSEGPHTLQLSAGTGASGSDRQ